MTQEEACELLELYQKRRTQMIELNNVRNITVSLGEVEGWLAMNFRHRIENETQRLYNLVIDSMVGK